jgi:oligoendopeptidase F
MRRDEDNAVAKYQAFCGKSEAMLAKASAAASFFTPEFLSIPKKRLDELIKEEKGLEKYEYSIRVMLREKAHILSKKEEALMAQLSEVLGDTHDVFTMMNNADLRFGKVKDEKGAKTELTHGNYINFMESEDRKVRKAAYSAMYDRYKEYGNTLATMYSSKVKTDVITAKVRGYDGALEKALSSDNVPVSVYENLIASVNENLPYLHRYMAVKRKVLAVPKLAMYDIYAPIYRLRSDKITSDKAVKLMCEGLAPLGKDYVKTAGLGAGADGWVDVYENEGKTSGAYSFGSYESKPYILMNFSGRLKDVFTLVHEMGHSMHSYYTRAAQPYRYGDHSIFTAEVASTVNESLLMHHLLGTMTKPAEQKYLINTYLEEFRTTLFRQTMFAEFELLTHRAAEAGEILTAEYLSAEYAKLNAKYFGDAVITDDRIAAEWSRIPHFYRAFYVYKYATGYSAATAISDIIIKSGPKDYIKFLKSGSSDDPIELLRTAGVHMDTPDPVNKAMKVFGELVERLEKI